MEATSSVKSMSMMPSSVWEDSQSFSTMVAPSTQWRASPSRDTQFLNSKNMLKKLKTESNHFQNPCGGFWWLEDSQLKPNSTNLKENGEKRVNLQHKILNSSSACQTLFTQWQCYQWHCFTCKKILNFSRHINKESINQSIGNFIMMMLWLFWPNFQESLRLFTDTSTKTKNLSTLITLSIGLPISLTCWDTTNTIWENVWEDIWQFTPTTKEVTSQPTLLISLDPLWLILIFRTQPPLTVLPAHSTDWPIKNASSG